MSHHFDTATASPGMARKGAEGELIISGHTGQVVKTDREYRAYAGLAPDLFVGDAAALSVFRKALWKEKRFEPSAFQSRQNFLAKANVTAIVIEIPSPLIGGGLVHGWATASLYGHAPKIRMSHWSLPLITHVFLSDPALNDEAERYNRATPTDDVTLFSKPISDFTEKVTRPANSAANPSEYANQILARICPTVLPYELSCEPEVAVAHSRWKLQ